TDQLDSRDANDLLRISKDFVKNPDIVGVGFADVSGRLMAAASQDPDFRPEDIGLVGRLGPRDLLQPRRVYSPILGSVVNVTAPVVIYDPESANGLRSTRLVGYVTMSLSENQSVQ